MSQENRAYAISQEGNNSIWYLRTLMTIMATGEDTRGAFGLMEVTAPPGAGAQPHIHRVDDEAFYIIEGTVTFFCGDQTFKAKPGTFVFLPRGITHSFHIEGSVPAKMLQINAPAGLEHYHEEMGEPAMALTIPPPPAGPPDLERMRALAHKYNIDLVLPPPGKLE